MDILYVSRVCSDKKFEEIFNSSEIKPEQQAQKFHSLLTKGLKTISDNVCIMTALPITRVITRKLWFPNVTEKIGNATYYYLPFINYPVLRHGFFLITGFFSCIAWSFKKKNQEKIVICDVLNLTVSISALLVSKVCRIKSVAIVTDIPNYMQSYMAQKKLGIKQLLPTAFRILCNFFMHRYDSYIVLTEQMNEHVNFGSKPHIVIEGMVDSEMRNMPNILENKHGEKVVLYAGALRETNGIKKLIESFKNLEMDDARLWLFGSGELEDEIRNYEEIDNRIKYFGVVPNYLVVEEELKATLLVNPRPSSEEFTKYSFPSKNMEYMVSGTPILTTSLPGMPEEYKPYVYLIEDETAEGLTNTLKVVLSKTKEELHLKGQEAKQFVLDNKNNVVQVKKIIDMITMMN